MTTIDADKQMAFRKYLSDSGVLDFTTKCAGLAVQAYVPDPSLPQSELHVKNLRCAGADLVALYEEDTRPSDALEFVKARLGAPTTVEVAAQEAEARRLQDALAAAQAELESLRGQLGAPGAAAAPVNVS